MITRNGESDLVVMSHETYNDFIDRMQLMIELMEADRDLRAAPAIPAEEVFNGIREMIREQIRS